MAGKINRGDKFGEVIRLNQLIDLLAFLVRTELRSAESQGFKNNFVCGQVFFCTTKCVIFPRLKTAPAATSAKAMQIRSTTTLSFLVKLETSI